MKIYTDSNPKTIAYISDKSFVKDITSLSLTSNEAEYEAVLQALHDNIGDVDILSDSQLVVNQLNHKYNIREDRLRTLALKVWKLCEGRKVTFTWIPRKENLAGRLLG